MAKVFVVVESNSYGGYEILGVCSSKEKAETAIKALIHVGRCPFGADVKEFEIDSWINGIIEELEQELKHYDKSKALLDKLKES